MLIAVQPEARQQALRAVSDALLALRRLERKPASGGRSACGVTASQGMLVHEVVLAGESGSTATGLANRLRTSMSAVTQLVDDLVETGILRRETDSEDRRRTRIVLTNHGRTLYGLFDAARLAQADALFQGLSDDELSLLADLLFKVTLDR